MLIFRKCILWSSNDKKVSNHDAGRAQQRPQHCWVSGYCTRNFQCNEPGSTVRWNLVSTCVQQFNMIPSHRGVSVAQRWGRWSLSCRLLSSSPPPPLSASASSPAPPSCGPRCVLAPEPSSLPHPRRTCACVRATNRTTHHFYVL